jgi:hypothetical protein
MALSKTFDPKKRISVDEALCHPYLSSYVSFMIIDQNVDRSDMLVPA